MDEKNELTDILKQIKESYINIEKKDKNNPWLTYITLEKDSIIYNNKFEEYIRRVDKENNYNRFDNEQSKIIQAMTLYLNELKIIENIITNVLKNSKDKNNEFIF